ncbi:MAG: hypothetical protein ACOH2H_19505 [Cypionkella sp.]
MSKSSRKKPANAPGAADARSADAKAGTGLIAALKGAITRPSDAGRLSANVGGKGSSANKGR